MKGFPYEEAVVFCDALRRLVGWREIGHTLGKYIKYQVQESFFEIGENEDYFSPFPLCTAWPELRPEDVDENLLRFTCYVAVCYTVSVFSMTSRKSVVVLIGFFFCCMEIAFAISSA